MPDTTKFNKKPERVAAGLKAVVHNKKMSQEARNNAAERLREMGVDPDEPLSARKAQGIVAAQVPKKTTDASSGPALRSHVQDMTDVEVHHHRIVVGGHSATL